MLVAAIDGGSEYSAGILIEFQTADDVPIVHTHTYLHNTEFLDWIYDLKADLVVFETLLSYGAAGQHVIDTAFWTGRFWTAAEHMGNTTVGLTRKTVLPLLLGKTANKGGDSKIRTLIVDLYGGQEKAIGNKKKGYGPLHGITSDTWQAFGVALAVRKALASGNAHDFYWDPFYTSSDLFKQRKAGRSKKKVEKNERKANKGRTTGGLKNALSDLLGKKKPAGRAAGVQSRK